MGPLRLAPALVALLVCVDLSSSFVVTTRYQKIDFFALQLAQQDGRSFDDGQRKQEMYMEAMSLKGAEQIAKMNISERTTRAMLAEAVEDRIFQLQDDLELLSGGTVPEDETTKAQCVELAKDIRRSQIQYNDLVSGAPSELLNSIKSWDESSQSEDTDAEQSAFE